jgi:hypothetical protein
MGLLKWLFGKSDERARGGGSIVFAGPSERPKLTPELAPYVKELETIYRRHNSFDRGDVRPVGERIEAAYGYNGMVTVCDTLRFTIGAAAASTLEHMWDGIGEWQS